MFEEQQAKIASIDNWLVTASSVQGANHARNKLPNQDAVGWKIKGDNLVTAVSDGHGSLKHFRSEIGAELAVESALEVMIQEVDVKSLTAEMANRVKTRVKEKLPQRVINQWRDKVREHYQNNLFSLDTQAQSKLAQLEEKKGQEKRKKLENNYIKAYGATLLIVLITKKFCLYFKLGDGDIMVFSQQGKRRLFGAAESFGPATNSLCMSEAYNKVEISLVPLSEEKPLFILLGTDGYVNSFRRDEDYLKVVDDFIELSSQYGIDYISDNLTEWLEQTTEEGSGDDISLALIFNKDLW